MEDALHHFYSFRRVFSSARTGGRAVREVNERQKQLRMEHDQEMRKAMFKTRTEREKLQKEWKDIINSETDELHAESAEFNFPKHHMMLHFRSQIELFGT